LLNNKQKIEHLFLLVTVLAGILALTACSSDVEDTTTSASIMGPLPVQEEQVQSQTDEVKNLLENQDKLNIYVSEGNIEACRSLDMEQFRNTCEANILVKQAKSKEDVTVCDKGSNEKVKEQCKLLVSKKTE
jgi:hypothetical protein